MFTNSIPCASRYDNYYAQSRGQSAQRVMAPHHGHNHLEHDKSLRRQVRFADDPGRSDCLAAERNLGDYSRCATCSVQCDSESHLPCVQCGAGTCVGCLVSNACPACYHAWQELPEIPALVRQHQAWRGIRKGTQTLLDSGTARAELLHDHGVRPHFVGKVLRAEVDRSRRYSDHGRVSTNSEEDSPHRVLLPSRFVGVNSLDGVRRSSHLRAPAGLRTTCRGLGKSCG